MHSLSLKQTRAALSFAYKHAFSSSAGFADHDVFALGRIRMISSEVALNVGRESCRGHRRVLQAPSNELSGIPTILGGLQSVARVYESMSSRAAKHAGTLIVLPVANRAFAHCRSNHEDWLPRALWHECLNGLSPLIRPSCSRFFISASISGMINGAKSAIRELR